MNVLSGTCTDVLTNKMANGMKKLLKWKKLALLSRGYSVHTVDWSESP